MQKIINFNFLFSVLNLQGNGDRAYLFEAKEILLATKAVTLLKKLNAHEKRNMQQYDKPFIKTLLISFIGIQRIKAGDIDKDTLKLIKSR